MLAAGALAVPESSVQMSSQAIMTIHYLASVFLDLEQKAWALVTCGTSPRRIWDKLVPRSNPPSA